MNAVHNSDTTSLRTVRLEQAKRWKQGNPIPIEQLLFQLQDLPDQDRVREHLVWEEIHCRAENGSNVDIESLVQLYPADLREEKRAEFEALLPFCHEFSNALGDPSLLVPGFFWVKELGSGGAGTVYLAKDFRLNREIAIKILRLEHAASPESLARFRQEAKAMAEVGGHEHIVDIHYVCEPYEPPYLVMEYVRGGTLSDRLSPTPDTATSSATTVNFPSVESRVDGEKPGTIALEPIEAASLLCRIAEGVQYAHERGVIHRDLKPGNILLTPEGEPKISDFGIARLSQTPERLTVTDIKGVGTPAYMSPEQCVSLAEAGPASDVYALGVILYELLTGRLPFFENSEEYFLAAMRRVAEEDPLPPSRHQPDLPRDLEAICLQCLEKLPEDRYASAADLAADLRRFLEDRPVTVRPANLAERSLKWIRRNRFVTAVLVGSLVLSVVFAWLWRDARQQTKVANEATQQMETAKEEEEKERRRTQEKVAHSLALLATKGIPLHELEFGSYRKVTQLFGEDERIRILFLKNLTTLLSSEDLQDWRCFYAVHAAVGLHPDRRGQALRLLHDIILDPETPRATRNTSLTFALLLGDTDPRVLDRTVPLLLNRVPVFPSNPLDSEFEDLLRGMTLEKARNMRSPLVSVLKTYHDPRMEKGIRACLRSVSSCLAPHERLPIIEAMEQRLLELLPNQPIGIQDIRKPGAMRDLKIVEFLTTELDRLIDNNNELGGRPTSKAIAQRMNFLAPDKPGNLHAVHFDSVLRLLPVLPPEQREKLSERLLKVVIPKLYAGPDLFAKANVLSDWKRAGMLVCHLSSDRVHEVVTRLCSRLTTTHVAAGGNFAPAKFDCFRSLAERTTGEERKQLVKNLLADLKKHSGKSQQRVALCSAFAGVMISEPPFAAQFSREHLIEFVELAENEPGTIYSLIPYFEALAAVLPKAPKSVAREVAGRASKVLETRAFRVPNREGAVLIRLVARIAPWAKEPLSNEFAFSRAKALFQEQPAMLMGRTTTIRSLVPSLTEEQILGFLEGLVSRATASPAPFPPGVTVAQPVAALAEGLDASMSPKVHKRLLDLVLNPKLPADLVPPLAAAMVRVGVRLPDADSKERVQHMAGSLVTRIEGTLRNRKPLRSLPTYSRFLAGLLPFLPSEQAAKIRADLLHAIKERLSGNVVLDYSPLALTFARLVEGDSPEHSESRTVLQQKLLDQLAHSSKQRKMPLTRNAVEAYLFLTARQSESKVEQTAVVLFKALSLHFNALYERQHAYGPYAKPDGSLIAYYPKLFSRLSNQSLLNLLEEPMCGPSPRSKLLSEFEKRFGRKFADVWDLVDWIRTNRSDLRFVSFSRKSR